MKIELLFGTETGTAEYLCDDIADAIGGVVSECTIRSLADVDPDALDPDAFYFFVTSTYGSGDLPTTAQPFGDKLEAQAIDLRAIRFAIFGLGDRVFDATFNQGSEKLMNMLLSRGGVMVGERGIYDASSSDLPEDIAVPWANDVLAVLQQTAA
ncbi:MAG: flavodoxin domain-containing protein [Pseudomonadota bacterium]